MALLDAAIQQVVNTVVVQSGLCPTATLIITKTGYVPELDQEVDQPLVSYSINVTPPQAVTIQDANGNSIVTKNMKTYCPGQLFDQWGVALMDNVGNPVVPAPGQQLQVGPTTYRIQATNPIYSGDAVALYEIVLAT